MARRRKRQRLGWLTLALVIAAVAAWHFFGDQVRWRAGLPVDRPPPKDGQLRVVSWNLHNFPGDDQDLARLRERLQELDADVIAVQEIKHPEALAELIPAWETAISEHGGSGHQRVGVLYDPASIELLAQSEHPELTMHGRVRPAFHAYLRHKPAGPDFHVVVVHLKAYADGLPVRREQWTALAKLLPPLTRDDPDLILLGDFNATGPKDGSAAQELRELDTVLASPGLRRIENPQGCSAYWDGQRRDAWQESSQLDLVFLAALDESTTPDTRVHASAHCARHACAAFRSTPAYPDLDYETISDHCPLVLDLAAGVDDDP